MCSGLAGNGVMGDMLGQSGVTGFVKDVLPIASWVAQPFMLGAGAGIGEAGAAAGEGAGAAGFAGEAGGTYAGTALTAEEAAAAGGAADAATVGGAAAADAAASDASTIPPLQDAGTGQVATDAGAGAGTGTGTGAQSADYLKKAKDALALAGAAAGVVKALTPAPTPPTAPAALPPPQTAQDADITAILKKNSLLFGTDSPTTTDLTKGSAGTGNLGRVSLLGGTSKLGG